jgi:uncharacterized protein
MEPLQSKNMTTQLVLTLLVIGLSAGILSGLVGVGGGLIIVPALVFFVNYTQHQAQGTSLGVLTFPVVILGFLQYYNSSKGMGAPIDLKVIAIIAITFLIGGYFGSQLALRLDEKMLKKIFAIFLFYTAFKMLEWDKVIGKWIKNLA